MAHSIVIDKPFEVMQLARADHYGPRRRGSPLFICMHHTDGVNSLDWLTWESSPPVSSHVLISRAGVIYRIVPDDMRAWTQGGGSMGRWRPGGMYSLNDVCLSIEFEHKPTVHPNYPVEQLRAGAHLVVWWWSQYGMLPLLNHSDVDARKGDPAKFPRSDFEALILGFIDWTSQ